MKVAVDLLASKFALEMMEAGLTPVEGIEVLNDMIRILEEKIKNGNV